MATSVSESNYLVLRATVHLPNLHLGQECVADGNDPYIANCIRTGQVVIVRPFEGGVEFPDPPGTITGDEQ